MLNLKKGLALVLAAATAFTFAPVANLGQSIVAEAAAADNSASVDVDATAAAGTSKTYSIPSGYYVILVDKKSSELTTAPSVKAKGSENGVADVDLTPVASDASSRSVFSVTQAKGKEGNVTLTFASAATKKNGTFNFQIKKVGDKADNESASATGSTVAAESSYTGNTATLGSAGNGVPETISVKVSKANAPTLAQKSGTTFYTNTATSYGISKTTFAGIGDANALVADFTDIKKDGTTSATSGTDYDANTFSYTSKNHYVDFANTTAGVDKNTGVVKIVPKVAGSDTITVSVKKGSDVYASATFDIEIKGSDSLITSFTWTDPTDGKVAYKTGTTKPAGIKDDDFHGSASGVDSVTLDTLVHKTVKFDVVASSAVTFVSSNTGVATVAQDGTVTVVKAGTAKITAYPTTDPTKNVYVTVYVSDEAQDSITAKVNGNTVDASHSIELDPSDSKAATAVKSVKIDATSAANLPITFRLTDSTGNSYGDSAIATVSSDGTVTAGSKTGTTYVTISTPGQGAIKQAKPVIVAINVNALPQADIQASDIRLDLKANKTAKIGATAPTGVTLYYDLDSDASNAVDIRGDVVTAKKVGAGKITIKATPTSTTRYTEKH